MWNLIDRGWNHEVLSKVEDQRLLVQHRVNDSSIRSKTQALRQSEVLRTGDKARLAPDGARYVYGFQVEPNLWRKFCRDHPDVYADLKGRDAIPRERAAAFIARHHPEWVLFSPRTS